MQKLTSKDKEGRILVNGVYKLCNIPGNCSRSECYNGWIVFDRDQVIGFDEIISEAEKKGIQVGWSNPCFEIWMYAYFGAMPAIQDSWTCCSDVGRILRTFKIKKNVEVTDNGKIII